MLDYPAAPSDPVDDGADARTEAFLSRYLARIGHAGPVAPTLEGLAALQAAHIAAIPFEAIDALTGAGSDSGARAVDAKLIDALFLTLRCYRSEKVKRCIIQ